MSHLPEFNPYSSPSMVPFASAPLQTKKPGYLTFLAVISLMLGCLGVLRGGWVVVSSAVGQGQFNHRNDTQGMPAAMEQPFRKLEADGNAIDARYGTFNKVMISLQAIIGLAMAVGAVMVLQGKRVGTLLMQGAFLLTLLVGMAHTGGFVYQILEMRPILDQFQGSVEGIGGEDRQAANIMVIAMMSAMWGGLIFGVLWLLIKAVLFGHGFFYLGKSQVQQSLS